MSSTNATATGNILFLFIQDNYAAQREESNSISEMPNTNAGDQEILNSTTLSVLTSFGIVRAVS